MLPEKSLQQRARSHTECEVADQIIPWGDVTARDLVLWDGEFCLVERINPMDSGNPAVVLEGDQHNGTIPVGTHAAVRRYVETEHPVTSRCECGGLARHQEQCYWRQGYGSVVVGAEVETPAGQEG